MTDQLHIQGAVPISDPDDSLLQQISEDFSESLQKLASFTPKEIQMSVLAATLQLYNSGRYGKDSEGMKLSTKDAVALSSLALNVDSIGGIFVEVTAEHHHTYNVFARAQAEADGMFKRAAK